MRLEFCVYGEPVTQGSKRAVPIKRGDGSFVMKDGRTLTRVVPHSPKLAQWRQEIAHAARQVYGGELLTGELGITLRFERPRPKSHYGKRGLKPSAPKYPTTRPDTLKLARAVEDALTGVVWRDDSQLVNHGLKKRFGPAFRVSVIIETLDETGGEA